MKLRTILLAGIALLPLGAFGATQQEFEAEINLCQKTDATCVGKVLVKAILQQVGSGGSGSGGGSNPGGGNGGGGAGGNGTGGNGTGFANFAKGMRVKRSGNLPCPAADFAPKFQGGQLKSLVLTCGTSPVNGTYVCGTEFVCKKGDATIEAYDETLDFNAGDQQAVFSKDVLKMAAKIVWYKDDGKCNSNPLGEATYTAMPGDQAAMTAFCNGVTATDAVWGVKLPGGVCKDVGDAAVTAVCPTIIKEAIDLFLTQG